MSAMSLPVLPLRGECQTRDEAGPWTKSGCACLPLDISENADDIGGATLYLCSRAGSHVTGANLPRDGGQSVQHGMSLFEED